MEFVIVGIGINLYEPEEGFPEDIREKAGSILGKRSEGKIVDRNRIAAELMTYGDFWQQVNRNCFQTVSLKTIRLQNRLLESMEFYDDGHLAIGAISQKDMDELQASQGDSEELAAWAKKIQGVNVSATLRQLDERVWKVSLRTDGSLNATKACGILGGGGHAAAAGATMRDVDEAEARARVLAAIRAVQQEG